MNLFICGHHDLRGWRWESALAAALLVVDLVRPSRSAFEAADAAGADVTFFGALCWDNALPPADLDAEPVEPLRSVFDAALAARELVTLDLAVI